MAEDPGVAGVNESFRPISLCGYPPTGYPGAVILEGAGVTAGRAKRLIGAPDFHMHHRDGIVRAHTINHTALRERETQGFFSRGIGQHFIACRFASAQPKAIGARQRPGDDTSFHFDPDQGPSSLCSIKAPGLLPGPQTQLLT